MSDIHIRNTEEHKIIYEQVFNNLYEYLKNVEKGIIVITGDILHNKEKQSSISQMLCVDLLGNLSKIMTTIIIPGNHDFNEKNKTIEDSLWSIVYKRKFKNLYYLRESGIYRFNNITFGISSLIDGIFTKGDFEDDNIKIGLYHGPIANSENSKGFEFSGKSITQFEGYDLVLLGDIHKYQYLNEEKTIAYASSLISQNFSETDKYHGVLAWDLETLRSEYMIIDNEYRYEEITLNNKKIYYDGQEVKLEELKLGKYSKVRINAVDIDREYYNIIVKNLIKLNPSINIVHNKLITQTIERKNDICSISIDSIIKDAIERVPDKIREEVKAILMYELKTSINNVSEKSSWQLLSLEFSNMLNYGENNIIDFTKLTHDEITGIFGENSLGKSSLIDILLFSLFDNYTRSTQNKNKTLNGSIINNKEKYFSCRVKFCINNSIYEINKTGSRKLAKSKLTNDSFKYTIYEFNKIDNDKKISLNGQDRLETLNNITKIVGTYNDFCVSSLCLQSNTRGNKDFYTMSSIDRKAFLNDKVNMSIYSEIEGKYKDLSKKNKHNIKFITDSDDYKEYNIDTKNNIEELKNNIIINSNELIKIDTNIDKIYKKEKNLQKKLLPINRKYNECGNDELEQLLKEYTEELDGRIVIDNIDDMHKKNLILMKQMNKIKHNYDIPVYKLKKVNKMITSLLNEIDISTNLYELKTKVKEGGKLLNSGFISKSVIEYYNKSLDKLIEIKYDNKNNELLRVRKNYTEYEVSKNDMDRYYKIANYNKYIEDSLEELKKFDIINSDKMVAEANKSTLKLLTNIKNSIDKNCKCCIVNSKEIELFIDNLGLNNDYRDIQQLYDNMVKLKMEINTMDKCNINFIIKTIDVLINIDEMKDKRINNNDMIDNLEQILFSYEQHNILLSINKIEEYNELINIKYYLESTINNQQLQKQIDENLIKISENQTIRDIINERDIIIETIKNKEYNKEIVLNINNLQEEYKILTIESIKLNTSISIMKREVEELLIKDKKYNEMVVKLTKLDNETIIYDQIVLLTGMKGIPRKIINTKLEFLEKEVNSILSKFINKNVYITKEIDDINIILLNKDGTKSDFGGGMETFILTLAFKIALSEVFNSSKCGLLIIDENVSILDKDHINKFNIISDFLKRYYNYILLITHIDGFQDYTIDKINIIKIKNKAKVMYI